MNAVIYLAITFAVLYLPVAIVWLLNGEWRYRKDD